MDFSLHKIVEQKLKNKKSIDKKNIIQSKEKGEERVENIKKVEAKHKKVKKEDGHRCGKRVLYFNDSFKSVGSMGIVPLMKKLKFGYEI